MIKVLLGISDVSSFREISKMTVDEGGIPRDVAWTNYRRNPTVSALLEIASRVIAASLWRT
jgi:hypothetical protein